MPKPKNARDIYLATKLFAEDVLVKAGATIGEQDGPRKVLYGYMVKALKSFVGAYRLVSEGYEEDADSLARTIFETVIQVVYLVEGDSKSPPEEKMSDRFARLRAYTPVAQYRYYLSIKELSADSKNYPGDTTTFANYLRRIEENWAFDAAKEAFEANQAKSAEEQVPRNTWYGKPTKQLIEHISQMPVDRVKYPGFHIGKKLMGFYYFLYVNQSLFVHSAEVSLSSYVREQDSELAFDWKPYRSEHGLSTVDSMATLLGIGLHYLVYEMALQDDEQIQSRRDALLKAMHVSPAEDGE